MIKLNTLYKLNSFMTISSGFILFITAIINSGLLISSIDKLEIEYFFIAISIFILINILYTNTLRTLAKKSIKEFFLKGPFSIIYVIYLLLINSYKIISPESIDLLAMSANGAYVFIGIRFIIEGSSQLHRYAERINTSATELTLISFFLIIMIGAFLLMLPGATTDNKGASFIDALFTSTSAVCVTGFNCC